MQLQQLIIPAVLLLVSCKQKEQEYIVQTKMLNEAVYASGSLMPAEYYFLSAPAYDRILQQHVQDGDTVRAGTTLAVLGTAGENRVLQLSEREALLAQQLAGSQSAVLQELDSKIALSKKEYEQDSLNAQRYSELAPERAVSLKDAEAARLQMEASRARFVELQQQYNSRRNELLRNALQADQQSARLLQSKEVKTLNSPISGKVYKAYYKTGDAVKPGDPLFLVGAPGRFKLEMLVDERDMARIRIGQEVAFQTDMYGDATFAAQVSKIDPVLQPDTRSFRVEAVVQSGKPFLPLSSVEANIVIRQQQPALLIPADYLLPGDSVWAGNKGQRQKIRVQRGLQTGNEVEITAGLRKGDHIIKPE